ncbi:hypothetical protein ANCCEY_04633 [Ancylostoma ceylanicum]|uniref:Uncharacterized protein n=1 Tax=Ancylostoma ceylanicum TaxID=53326 RepID=A0A0D6M1R3_9BILA|nr:hypothetical protein ANCCEY_04633 [Ancylostoma ceylanicum]
MFFFKKAGRRRSDGQGSTYDSGLINEMSSSSEKVVFRCNEARAHAKGRCTVSFGQRDNLSTDQDSFAEDNFCTGHEWLEEGLDEEQYEGLNQELLKKVQKRPPSLQSSAQTAARRSSEDASRRASKAAKRAQVKVFVEETFKKGVKGLIAEFKSMKRMNDFTKMTEFVAQNAEGRNRYKNAKKCAEYFPVEEERPLTFDGGVCVVLKKQEPTEHQYLYIHQVLLLYLKKTKYLDESVTPYLEAFTRDYISATKGF